MLHKTTFLFLLWSLTVAFYSCQFAEIDLILTISTQTTSFDAEGFFLFLQYVVKYVQLPLCQPVC